MLAVGLARRARRTAINARRAHGIDKCAVAPFVALKHRLPSASASRRFTDAGGLLAYAADIQHLYRDSAVYLDKILKGAKPGDLPVQGPIQIELVINLKTAKGLGLTVPQSILIRADEVIE